MADLKKQGRMIESPQAPDLSGAINAPLQLQKAAENVVKPVAEHYAELRAAQKALEEKSLLAGATTDINRLSLKYSTNPNLGIEDLKQFRSEAQEISSGWLQKAEPTVAKRLALELNTESEKLTTSLLKNVYEINQRNQKRDAFLSLEENKKLYSEAISSGDYEGAAKYKSNATSIIDALSKTDVSAEKLLKESKEFEVAGLTAEAFTKLKRARTSQQRTDIMKALTSLPENEVNNIVFNNAYKEYTRLEKIYKEGEDLSKYVSNIAAGQNFNNYNIDGKDANKLVNMYAVSDANKPADQTAESKIPYYKDEPQYEGQEPAFSFMEDGVKQYRYLAEATTKALQETPERAPTLQNYANAVVQVGAKNPPEFMDEIINRLWSGGPQQVLEAVEALNYINNKNPNLIVLDDKSDTIYSAVSQGINSGETDMAALIKHARGLIAPKSNVDQAYLNEAYSSQFSLGQGKARKNLESAFRQATGAPLEGDYTYQSMVDFNSILKRKFNENNGNTKNALDSAKRELTRTHGSDMFSPLSKSPEASIVSHILENPEPVGMYYQYMRYPITKLFPGLTETQISNQIIETLLDLESRSMDVVLPKHYHEIKDADEGKRALTTFSFPAPYWSIENKSAAPAPYITLKINNETHEGRVFLKPNQYTTQNNSGIPVWELWIQDRAGKEYAIPDDSSPFNNTAVYQPQKIEQWTPLYAEQERLSKIEKSIDESLAIEGRLKYPIFDGAPIYNAIQRRAYQKDIENRERLRRPTQKISDEMKKDER